MTSSYARSTFGNVVNGNGKSAIKTQDQRGGQSSPARSKKSKSKKMTSRNSNDIKVVAPIRTIQPPRQAVSVKEMTMNRVDFGELVFGGNPMKNLKVEA